MRHAASVDADYLLTPLIRRQTQYAVAEATLPCRATLF